MDFEVYNRNKGAKITLNEHPYEGHKDVTLVDIDITFPEPCCPSPVEIEWNIPCIDTIFTLSANDMFNSRMRQTWHKRVTESRLAYSAPIHQLVAANGENRMTIALSDAMTPCKIYTGIEEHWACVNCGVILFSKPIAAVSSYHASIYLDFSKSRFDDARRAVDAFWTEVSGYPCAYIPDIARRPLYSTWYSFHQALNVDEVVRQCEMAKSFGMESVIVDDGWQCEGSDGYNNVGDWEPAAGKIGSMRNFVDRIHAVGMKVTLWFHFSAVGIDSKVHKLFSEKKYILNRDCEDWPIYDPRFPETRRYFADLYARVAREWDLDGVKLDFIDSFNLSHDTPAFDPRWDTTSLEEGIDRLMKQVTEDLRAFKPDMMIEFRQDYYGPVIRKYGNMIRVSDCAMDPICNHIASFELRTILGKTAVHSDMLMWHVDTPVEDAAMEVISTLFSVPQISVLLDKIPEEHRIMLKHYLGFWNEHRETLLDGTLYADNPGMLYSQIRAEAPSEVISVAMSKNYIKYTGRHLFFVNATGSDMLVVDFEGDTSSRTAVITDCMGNITERRVLTPNGVEGFRVPHTGMIEII